ncbi:MAG: YhbY family RNA-binding protein [Desulfurococcaceae archaeon]|jgi:RNA-binding protein
MDKKIHDKESYEKVKARIAGKVDMQLGKSGITEGFLNELRNRLNKHGVVKIRVLKSFRRYNAEEVEQVARYLAEQTGSSIYEVRGFTLVLTKKQRSK